MIGLRAYDCFECDRSGPDQGRDQKLQRNCKKPGVEITGEAEEGKYRIDFTGIDSRDFCSFCPASVADSSIQRQIYRVIDIERLSAVGRVMARPILHQPIRIKNRILAILGARDRFNDEIAAAEIEVTRPL